VSAPKEPPLTPRLDALAEAIPRGSRVADVGSDHGRLARSLVSSGRASFCLATEATSELTARIGRPPAEGGWASRLAFRAGDGLAAIRTEDAVDTVVLAGMGAGTILRILGNLSRLQPEPRRLILQPRTDETAVRRWLATHGWRLVFERLTDDRGRLHLTIAAERGEASAQYRHPLLSRADLLASGPLLVAARPPELIRRWEEQRTRLAAIVARGAGGPAAARARTGLARAERIVKAISTPAG
jgi:tRNA (adenine22-N1)-methyltransferase